MLGSLHQKSVDDLLSAVSDGAIAPRAVLEAVSPGLKRTETAGELDTTVIPLRRPRAPQQHARHALAGLAPGIAFHYRRLLPSGAGRARSWA